MEKRVYLPEEIISQIITSSGLDLKSIIKCMGVCKQWRNLVSDLISNNPLVAKGKILVHHFSLRRFGALDDETLQIAWMYGEPHLPQVERLWWSSCNGLVCFLSENPNDIYICNPLTGEYISIPNPHVYIHIHQLNLGFCSSTNEYKLTCLSWLTLETYTLGSPAGWRSVPFDRQKHWFPRGATICAPICVDGVFYWLLETQNILTFDLAKEVFGTIPIPLPDKEIYQIGCMDHCLAVTSGHDPSLGLEIWARKEEKSSGESVWTKNWVIDVDRTIDFKPLIPVKLSTGGRIIMTYQYMSLYSYDPRNKLGRLNSSGGRVLHAYNYTPTLISPKKLMPKNGQERIED